MRSIAAATFAALAVGCGAGPAYAASPAQGTLTPDADGHGSLTYTGTVTAGGDEGGTTDGCFGADKKPDATSGCDFFVLNVAVPAGFYDAHPGAVEVNVDQFNGDVDLGIYRRNPDGTRGDSVGASGNLPQMPEQTSVASASGSYYIAVVPYAALPGQTYRGRVSFFTRRHEDPAAISRLAPVGFPNYRASHDGFTSHSETSIAMDPRNHDHLIAASKMYENNAKYLFKVGSYESFDGGRTWKDLGQLPGYCQGPGQCNPADEANYRTVSDPSVAFDDEGDAYLQTLDAPGGTFAFHGFNMTVAIKRPGQPWSNPITVHDNRNNPVSDQFLLDDKNWIAIDNTQDADGGVNRPGDGKVGPMYICWGLDQASSDTVPAPAVGQEIVVERSLDGGKTWGGFAPGDNTPYPLSERAVIGGVGCHLIVGPDGTVYATWYDNLAGVLMQTRSTDRGQTWLPAYPIAMFPGFNTPFPGQGFRNLSIPSTAIDSKGNLYAVVDSVQGQGSPILGSAFKVGAALKTGQLDDVREAFPSNEVEADSGDQATNTNTDVILFKSSDGGNTWSGPVRVNQDKGNHDQFQPWIAVTPKGQLDVMYFDRRNSPENYLIDTYLSRSNDGGKTFTDTRVSDRMWDPAINPPTSVSGQFIGDYQGIVADDSVAIPFWNATQSADYPKSDPRYSPWQEAYAARVPNTPVAFVQSLSDGQTIRLGRRQTRLHVRGSAEDPSGGSIGAIEVSLQRGSGGKCSSYAPGKRRFVRGSCSDGVFFAARGTRQWLASIPVRALRRGRRYRLRVRAVGSQQTETPNEPGRDVVTFRVK